MENILKEKFNFIWKCKFSKDREYQEYIQKYLKKVLNQLSNDKRTYNYKEFNKDKSLEKPGVYLIYALKEDGSFAFTYVGESENVLKRWKQHVYKIQASKETLYKKMRKKLLLNKISIENVRFIFLDELADQNERLYRETYYIYLMKGRLISLNSKNCSRKLRCPNGHGLIKTKLLPKYDGDKLKLVVQGVCRKKDCKITFEIR